MEGEYCGVNANARAAAALFIRIRYAPSRKILVLHKRNVTAANSCHFSEPILGISGGNMPVLLVLSQTLLESHGRLPTIAKSLGVQDTAGELTGAVGKAMCASGSFWDRVQP
jgi:hypothetical protein